MNRGDLLGTIFFNLANTVTAVPADGASGVTASLIGGNQLVDSSTLAVASNQSVNGSWVFGTQTDGDRRYNYGISSSGFGNTTTGGTVSATANGVEAYSFAASGMTLGGGGDDYMLTNPGLTGINGGATPVIRSAVRLQVTGLTGLTSTAQLQAVGVGFASGAFTTGIYNIGTGLQVTIPEPASLALAVLGISGLVAVRRRK